MKACPSTPSLIWLKWNSDLRGDRRCPGTPVPDSGDLTRRANQRHRSIVPKANPRPAIPARGFFVFRNRAAAARCSNLFDALSRGAVEARRRPSPTLAFQEGKPRMTAAGCLIALAIGGLLLILISEVFP